MSDRHLPHLADRVLGTPLMIEPRKLRTVVHVLGERIGVEMPPVEMDHRLDRQRQRTDIHVQDGVARIQIIGSLVHRSSFFSSVSGLSSYETIGLELELAVEDPSVRAILLEIDSPGGEVNGVFDLADKISAAAEAKPVYAIAADLAASAAYLLGSAADRFFVAQAGLTGSIGVIALRWDETGALEAEGLAVTEIFAGARKVDGSPLHAINDDELAALQGMVDRTYDLFVAKVAANRGISEEAVRATEAGVFIGSDGVDVGLVDGVANTEALLAQLSETGRGRDRLTAVMETEDGMNDEGKTTPEITAAYVAESHPDVAAELRAEGAAAERDRIRAVEEIGAHGHEELVAELKYEPGMTAEQAALRIMQADHAARAGRIEALRTDEKELDKPAAATEPAGSDTQAEVNRTLAVYRAARGGKPATV